MKWFRLLNRFIKNVRKFRLILRADSKIIEELRMNFVSVFKKYLLEIIFFYLYFYNFYISRGIFFENSTRQIYLYITSAKLVKRGILFIFSLLFFSLQYLVLKTVQKSIWLRYFPLWYSKTNRIRDQLSWHWKVYFVEVT